MELMDAYTLPLPQTHALCAGPAEMDEISWGTATICVGEKQLQIRQTVSSVQKDSILRTLIPIKFKRKTPSISPALRRMPQSAIHTLAPRPQGTVCAEGERMASARSNLHAAFERQSRHFAGTETWSTVADSELAVQIVAPAPDAITGANNERVLRATRYADDWLAELAHGSDGKEVQDVAGCSLISMN